jgi:hypothetical protein
MKTKVLRPQYKIRGIFKTITKILMNRFELRSLFALIAINKEDKERKNAITKRPPT